MNARCFERTASRISRRVVPTVKLCPSSRSRDDRFGVDQVAGVPPAHGVRAPAWWSWWSWWWSWGAALVGGVVRGAGEPAAHLVEPCGARGRLDLAHPGIDVAQVGVEAPEVEVEVRQEVGLVDDHHVGRPEHHRIARRLLHSPSVTEEHHQADVLADVELGRADQVADVLDDDEVELVERQARRGRPHHRRIEASPQAVRR
ncbi:MAG: hypothetical protein U0Q03_06910 [Acidimicrobiales bacterium]